MTAAALTGLSSQLARERLATDGPNELPTAKRRSIGRELWDVVREPMLLLLLGAGTVNFLLSEPLDGVVLMLFVLVVIAISLYQEHKTENALAALRDLSSPRALVVRDGRQQRIAGREVVRGDVILLSEGDRVPADAMLVDCENFSVDESALTGESVPVRKAEAEAAAEAMGQPGGDATPWVFSGTLVVRGHGIAVVLETGAATELGRIGTALRSIEPERTPLQREIRKVVGVFAVGALAAAVTVTVVYGITRGQWLEAALAGIATAMATLPEEFPVVLTVFLALGAWRMSQRNVLTRQPPVIEALGAATTVCVDKTGTLTMNTMTVRELVAEDFVCMVDEGPLPEAVHRIAEFGALASPIDPFDPMDRAFKQLTESHLAGTEHIHHDWELVREYPLSEALLALSHVWRSPDASRYVVAAKGAPEAITDLCHMDPGAIDTVMDHVERASADGLRVIAVACAYFDARADLPTEQHDFDFEYVGLAGLFDPVRPSAARAVADCLGAGVRVVMITGDYAGTALAVARDVGIDASGGSITGPELDTMDDAELERRVGDVSIYARMVPEQKLRLVRALQRNGEVVGMTGDGVNDAPALRAADIGIAMGQRGTDVARESAGLVITDDDFASIADGIRQGRGIFDNLRKAMAYIVAVHVPIFAMALLPVFVADWPLVLLPVQIAFLQLIIDPACSIVFQSEEIDPLVMRQPPRGLGAPLFGRRVLTISVLQGTAVLAGVLSVYLWTLASNEPNPVVRSATFATLVFGNLALILVNRSWRLSVVESFRERRNPTLKWILLGATALLVASLTLPLSRDVFGFGALPPHLWFAVIVVALLSVTWFEIYKFVTRR